MNIAIFSDAFYPQVNGVVTHLLNIIPLLAKENKVHVFVPDFKEKCPEKIENCTIHYLPSLSVPIYKDFKATSVFYPGLENKLKELNIDVIHVQAPSTVGWCGLFLGKKLKIPIIGTFHTYFMDPGYLKIIHLDTLGLDKSKTFNNLLWKFSNSFYGKCAVVVAPTKMVRDDLVAHLLTSKVEVVSVGVDPKPYMRRVGSRQQVVGRGQESNERYFLFLGRLSQGKSLDILLDAYAKAVPSIGEIKLKIVGDGPERKALEQRSREVEELRGRVEFIGVLDKEQKATIYQNALAFVSASTSETFGLTFLEAMCCGTPVIGVAAGGSYEIIDGFGLVCKPNDVNDLSSALVKIATDDSLRKELSKKALEGVKEHTIDRTVEKLEKIYNNLEG